MLQAMLCSPYAVLDPPFLSIVDVPGVNFQLSPVLFHQIFSGGGCFLGFSEGLAFFQIIFWRQISYRAFKKNSGTDFF